MNVRPYFNKGLFFSLSYSLILFVIDKMKEIKLKEPRYENIKLINYIFWVVLAFSTLFLSPYFELFFTIIISTAILINFTYEILFYKPDSAHIIHHVLTMIAILYSIYYDIFKFPIIYKAANIFYMAMFSSIFSAGRKLLKDTKYASLSYNTYKVSYVVSKLLGIFFHYKLFFGGFFINAEIKVLLFLKFLIHLTQIYF